MTLLPNISEIVEAHKKGKIGSVITVESGHSIGTSLAVLRQVVLSTHSPNSLKDNQALLITKLP